MRYFRTQITRTTDVLASDDPSLAFTPLALRNSRTVSAGTSAASVGGATFGGPATMMGFSSAMPANFPSANTVSYRVDIAQMDPAFLNGASPVVPAP